MGDNEVVCAGRWWPHGGIKERKGKPPMPSATMMLLSVSEAASVLDVAPRTVRRWLQEGQLVGRKIGSSWVVLCPEDQTARDPSTAYDVRQQTEWSTPRVIRQRLRQVGQQLIVVGNMLAGAQRARGEVFLTWRRPRRLQITFAIGRTSPTQGWAPYALGTELPFWLENRERWDQVRRLLRRYEQLRLWCHPRLLPIPKVQEVVLAELHRLQAALEACTTHEDEENVRQKRWVNSAEVEP
jgi:excisionase family DNA binding protein